MWYVYRKSDGAIAGWHNTHGLAWDALVRLGGYKYAINYKGNVAYNFAE